MQSRQGRKWWRTRRWPLSFQVDTKLLVRPWRLWFASDDDDDEIFELSFPKINKFLKSKKNKKWKNSPKRTCWKISRNFTATVKMEKWQMKKIVEMFLASLIYANLRWKNKFFEKRLAVIFEICIMMWHAPSGGPSHCGCQHCWFKNRWLKHFWALDLSTLHLKYCDWQKF